MLSASVLGFGLGPSFGSGIGFSGLGFLLSASVLGFGLGPSFGSGIGSSGLWFLLSASVFRVWPRPQLWFWHRFFGFRVFAFGIGYSGLASAPALVLASVFRV